MRSAGRLIRWASRTATSRRHSRRAGRRHPAHRRDIELGPAAVDVAAGHPRHGGGRAGDDADPGQQQRPGQVVEQHAEVPGVEAPPRPQLLDEAGQLPAELGALLLGEGDQPVGQPGDRLVGDEVGDLRPEAHRETSTAARATIRAASTCLHGPREPRWSHHHSQVQDPSVSETRRAPPGGPHGGQLALRAARPPPRPACAPWPAGVEQDHVVLVIGQLTVEVGGLRQVVADPSGHAELASARPAPGRRGCPRGRPAGRSRPRARS